jgi:hypothetical protein
MPTNRHPIRHPHRGRLTHAQDMVLQYGFDERWADAFRDESEHRDAWVRNRDRLLAWYRHARRPQAWWHFEAPFRYPGYDREQSTLYAAGLLTAEELAELDGFWREEFDRAQQPDFFHCEGPGRFLKGEPAKRAHYQWADIPRALVKQWTTQRRRRTIRELEATSPAV